VAALAVLVSVLLKLLASAIWPAYVTSGWLRFFGPQGTRRRDCSCRTAVSQGFKASYQVLWFSDVFTNAFILGDLSLLHKVVDEFGDFARGRRDDLSSECRRLSCLPPVKIGLFGGGSWDLAAQEVAQKLGVSTNKVDEAWRSLARQMIRIGREAVADDLLTSDWVASVPAELCIGLPARSMLETLERSHRGAIVLSSGLVITSDRRPTGPLFDELWERLMEARDALDAAVLSGTERESLCAALLAGGGAPGALPLRLATAVEGFERLPPEQHGVCQAILRPLIAVSVTCSKQQAYKEKLMLVIEGITSDGVEDYLSMIDGRSADAQEPWPSDESSALSSSE